MHRRHHLGGVVQVARNRLRGLPKDIGKAHLELLSAVTGDSIPDGGREGEKEENTVREVDMR